MAVPAEGFRYTKGEPKRFSRSDLPSPATRESVMSAARAAG